MLLFLLTSELRGKVDTVLSYVILCCSKLAGSQPTFREQGVDENETLLLIRSSFTLIRMWTQETPQLNLLYVQVQYRMLRPWGWWAFQNSGCGWWRAATGLWFLPCLWRSLSIMSYGAGWRPLWAASHPERGWLASSVGVLVATAVSVSWLAGNCWLTHSHVLLLSPHI